MFLCPGLLRIFVIYIDLICLMTEFVQIARAKAYLAEQAFPPDLHLLLVGLFFQPRVLGV